MEIINYDKIKITIKELNVFRKIQKGMGFPHELWQKACIVHLADVEGDSDHLTIDDAEYVVKIQELASRMGFLSFIEKKENKWLIRFKRTSKA